jgi:2-amino-4-hydroxy-6-hydroxymethyldihydropteridine diphosphokinase
VDAPVAAHIGLGANLGRPEQSIRDALRRLTGLPSTVLCRSSSLYRTAPIGFVNQPEYVNAVAELLTGLSARQLLEQLLDVERAAGRARSFPNAPRILDLDLLLYGTQRIDEPGLQVPHPRMHERRFVLEPLVELDPGLVIPGVGTAREALGRVLAQPVQRVEG